MPSIRVLRSPKLEQLNDMSKLNISLGLQSAAAKALEFSPTHVEVLWIPVEFALNEADLAVEVLFSCRPGYFEPTPEIIERLAVSLLDVLEKSLDIPIKYNEVSAWALPQNQAFFNFSRRKEF